MRKSFFLAVAVFIFISGCNNGSSSDSPEQERSSAPALSSRCGVVSNSEVYNPLPEQMAEPVEVEAVSADTVVVTRTTGQYAGTSQVVKLHGVSADSVGDFANARGIKLIEEATSASALLVVAGDCVAQFDGGQGVYGQIFTLAGQSLSELLLEAGVVKPQVDGCGSEALVGCYSTIEVTRQFSSKTVSWFLWKPVSESNGNLAVLVDPESVDVVVKGAVQETGSDRGPSNGRGTTSRFTHRGCTFGNDVVVEFYDRENGLLIPLVDGRENVVVPRGCDRYEFRL